MGNEFTAAEVLDLIQEVGHSLILTDVVSQSPGNPKYGSPGSVSHSKTDLQGYVTEKSGITLPGAPAKISSGEYTAFISSNGGEIDTSVFTANCRIIWQARTFQVEYLIGLVARGKTLVHKVNLIQTQNTQTVDPADAAKATSVVPNKLLRPL